jgi:hypothetical protein
MEAVSLALSSCNRPKKPPLGLLSILNFKFRIAQPLPREVEHTLSAASFIAWVVSCSRKELRHPLSSENPESP